MEVRRDNITICLAQALISLIRTSKSLRISFKAKTLLAISKLEKTQSNVLKAAHFCRRLWKAGLVRADEHSLKKNKVSRVIRYYVDATMPLWRYAKTNPEKALELVVTTLHRRDLC